MLSSHTLRAWGALLLGSIFAVGLALPATAKVHLSRKEALEWAFPGAARVEEKTHVLSAAQANAVEQDARSKLESKIVKLYTAYDAAGQATGYAVIDIHTVRTLPEAFLVVMTPEGKVRNLRVLAFYEPPEYEPSKRWLEQFEARGLEDETRIGGAIHGIAGSTLSARAVAGGVRRALALHRLLVKDEAPAAGGANEPLGER